MGKKKPPTITLPGLVASAIIVLVLFAGLSASSLAPHSFIGKLTASDSGQKIWLGFTLIIIIPVIYILEKSGVKFYKYKDDE